jgi:hypothetical protein
MFNFVTNYLTNREKRSEYQQMLTNFFADGKLDESETIQLDEFSKKFGFTKDDLRELHKRVTSSLFQNISKDERITEEEKKDLEVVMSYFGLSQADFEFNQATFNKFYSLALIDGGILPIPQHSALNLILKKGEIIHWLCPGTLKKHKRVNYSGLSGSIKIMKGIRYRVGSMKLAPQTNEITVEEDAGNFWMSNQRVGFIGSQTNFAIP